MAVPDATPIRVPKTAEVIAAHVRREIARGRLRPGDRLPPEDELLARFRVARTTLREALRILESEDLIEIRRGRKGGPFVTTPSLDRVARGFALLLQLAGTTVLDLYEARELIEPQLAARLARSRTQADLDALARVVDATFDVAKAGDRRAFAAAATRVHETLVERAGNTTLAHVAMLLHELVAQYYVHVVQFHRVDEAVMSKAARSYRKLLSLIEAGDAEGAEAHWRRQMRFTIERSDTEAPVDLFEAAWT